MTVQLVIIEGELISPIKIGMVSFQNWRIDCNHSILRLDTHFP